MSPSTPSTPRRAGAYCDDESLELKVKGKHVVVKFSSFIEGEDFWEEGGEDWMPRLIALRDDLMSGDTRAFYLAWLASIQWSKPDEGLHGDEEGLEPPVPPGLANLSEPLRALAEFLRVDDTLIEVAAAGSVGEPPRGPSRDKLAAWVKGLPAAEKDDYLSRFFAGGEDLPLRAELSRRAGEAFAARGGKAAVSGAGRRKVARLLAARDDLAATKARAEAERSAKEKARRDREEAEARAKHLDELARREPEAWNEVETLIASTIQKNYDLAVKLLVDLRDLLARSGRDEEAAARILEIRRRHQNKPSLVKRFNAKNLGT